MYFIGGVNLSNSRMMIAHVPMWIAPGTIIETDIGEMRVEWCKTKRELDRIRQQAKRRGRTPSILTIH